MLMFAAKQLRVNIRSMLDALANVYNCESLRPAYLEIRDSVCCGFGCVLSAVCR